MDVHFEPKALKWCNAQASLYCDDDWILAYEIQEMGEFKAVCYLCTCNDLNKKHNVVSPSEYMPINFPSIEEAKQACEKHYRELILKAFLQAV